MNKKIDISRIMKGFEDKLRDGLSENKLDVTGISKLIGEHLEKAREKVLKDSSELINEEVKPSTQEQC